MGNYILSLIQFYNKKRISWKRVVFLLMVELIFRRINKLPNKYLHYWYFHLQSQWNFINLFELHTSLFWYCCVTFYRDMNKCLFAPDKAQNANQKKKSDSKTFTPLECLSNECNNSPNYVPCTTCSHIKGQAVLFLNDCCLTHNLEEDPDKLCNFRKLP